MTTPPSAPDLVADRLATARESAAKHRKLGYSAYRTVNACWLVRLDDEIERLTLGWEKTARDQQQEIERLREVRDELTRQAAKRQTEQRQEIERLRALAEQAEVVAQTEAHKLLKLSEKWNALCVEHDRLTRERDELKADLTSKDPMHMDSAGRWESAAMQYAHERDRLRAIISTVDGMLFDGADPKRIRAYLQRESKAVSPGSSPGS